MKYLVSLSLTIIIAAVLNSCMKDTYENYHGGVASDAVSCLDIRPIYKGTDVVLTQEIMYGGKKLAAVVVSDHSAKNLPEGLLVVQDSWRLDTLRGISIELGAEAANYHPGDSVWVHIEGGTLTRKNGILLIAGVKPQDVTAKGKGTLSINVVTSLQLQSTPQNYESTLCLLNKSSFVPSLPPGAVIGGARTLNDGFGDVTLFTEPGVDYANNAPLALGAYVGIPFRTVEGPVQYRTRNGDDLINMGVSAQDLLITGIQSDPKGGDGGYEYVQMMATTDIDFWATPYSMVFSGNAGTAASATPLDAGWATGGQRTIKYVIDSGIVKKGKFVYLGFQFRKINGSAGTHSFPASAFFMQKNFLTTGTNPNRGDGGLVRVSQFGTSGPWANSGNTCGVAIFKGKTVTEASVPEDVLFIATGGGAAIYDASKSPILGYRICNNDWYSMYSVDIDQSTYKPRVVPFLHYRSAVNVNSMPYPINEKFPAAPTDAGLFNMMGGVYNIKLARWTTARKQTVVELVQTTATIDTLELHPAVTKLVDQ